MEIPKSFHPFPRTDGQARLRSGPDRRWRYTRVPPSRRLDPWWQFRSENRDSVQSAELRSPKLRVPICRDRFRPRTCRSLSSWPTNCRSTFQPVLYSKAAIRVVAKTRCPTDFGVRFRSTTNSRRMSDPEFRLRSRESSEVVRKARQFLPERLEGRTDFEWLELPNFEWRNREEFRPWKEINPKLVLSSWYVTHAAILL